MNRVILLQELLYKVNIEQTAGKMQQPIEQVHFDSKKIAAGHLFVAIKGLQVDAHQYIGQAIENGAVAIVCQTLPTDLKENVTYVKVTDTKAALGIIASNYYGNPSEKIKLIGITGTNGKTTTTSMLHEVFTRLGYGVGLISTIKIKIGDRDVPTTHTTPDPLTINLVLEDMLKQGCEYCFMEVSSHAIDLKRVHGLFFSGGVFTNISHDHLDYHKTFSEYIKVKKSFFDTLPKEAFALTNMDDKNGMLMLQNTKASVSSYSLSSMSDFKARILESGFDSTLMRISPDLLLTTKLSGEFNAYNVLAVYAVAILLEQESLDVLTNISALNPVEGRFQQIQSKEGVIGIVDYAHTPDALKNVLETITSIRTRNENLITVIGCGGDRDKSKRPLMANIACKLSDKVIFTSDNPRNEDPEAIVSDMQKGIDPVCFKNTLTIINRAEAIKTACLLAKDKDIILVAGKGHEKYQETKGVRKDFDDLQELSNHLDLIDQNL